MADLSTGWRLIFLLLFFLVLSLSFLSLFLSPPGSRWGGPEETEPGKRVYTETAIVPGVDWKWIRGPLLYCFQFFVLVTLHTVFTSYLAWGSLVERPLKLGLVLFSMMSSWDTQPVLFFGNLIFILFLFLGGELCFIFFQPSSFQTLKLCILSHLFFFFFGNTSFSIHSSLPSGPGWSLYHTNPSICYESLFISLSTDPLLSVSLPLDQPTFGLSRISTSLIIVIKPSRNPNLVDHSPDHFRKWFATIFRDTPFAPLIWSESLLWKNRADLLVVRRPCIPSNPCNIVRLVCNCRWELCSPRQIG